MQIYKIFDFSAITALNFIILHFVMEEERPRKRDRIIKGFSKLLKEDKLKAVSEYIENPGEFIALLQSFWYSDTEKQKQFDEFSENTIFVS